MAFCSNCGNQYQEGSKFCNGCGTKIGEDVVNTNINVSSLETQDEHVIWEGKPAGLTAQLKDKANVNSTTYTLTNQRIIIKTGLIGKKQEEIELIRVKDVSVKQGLKDRAMGVGNVTVSSTDVSMPALVLTEIKNPNEVKEKIREAVRKEKSSKGMGYIERV